MRFRRLFGVRVRVEGEACTALWLEPRPERADGTRALARHRLILRHLPDGIDIACPIDGSDVPQIPFPEQLNIAFDVHVEDLEAAGGIELGLLGERRLRIYRGSSPAGGALASTLEEIPPGAAQPPPGVVAGVEISGVSSAWLAAPPTFELALSARRAFWVYYVLTRGTPSELGIVDTSQDDAIELTSDLVTASAADDPVGRRLVAAHPGRACVRFTSTRALPSFRAQRRRLELRAGGEVQVSCLPSPSIHHRIGLPGEPPRPVLFHTIEL